MAGGRRTDRRPMEDDPPPRWVRVDPSLLLCGNHGARPAECGPPLFLSPGGIPPGTNDLLPAKDAGWKIVMGETLAPHPDDVMESDLVILWGSMPSPPTSIFSTGYGRRREEERPSGSSTPTRRTPRRSWIRPSSSDPEATVPSAWVNAPSCPP